VLLGRSSHESDSPCGFHLLRLSQDLEFCRPQLSAPYLANCVCVSVETGLASQTLLK